MAAEDGRELEPLPELARSIELVRRGQEGDEEAVNELLARYRPRLVRILRVRVGADLHRRLDEEDVVQEALLIAARRLREFELRSHAGLLAWLARIGENVARKMREHHDAGVRDRRREHHPSSGATRRSMELAKSDPTPSQRASRAEFEALVDAQVERLEPPEYREVIVRRDYMQEEWEDIRRELGRPTVAAIQELHRRAHSRLRERLRKYLDPG